MTALSVTPHRYTVDEAMREIGAAKLEIDPYGHISGAALRWCETVLGSAFGFPVRVREEPEFSRHLEIVPMCHAAGEAVCKRSAL